MHEMEQDAQHANGSNRTDDELRKENELLQQKYDQLVQDNDRKLKNIDTTRPEAVDGYEMMMRYVQDFKTFLDEDRARKATNMISVWNYNIREKQLETAKQATLPGGGRWPLRADETRNSETTFSTTFCFEGGSKPFFPRTFLF